MSETIARQYELAGIKPLSPWPRVNEMGEHAMVQKVKYRLENATGIGRLLEVFSTCVNLRREFRSWKYKTDAVSAPCCRSRSFFGHTAWQILARSHKFVHVNTDQWTFLLNP